MAARLGLDAPNILDHLVQGAGHQLVHRPWVIALDEIRGPPAAADELLQFLMLDAGQHGGITDLVAVEVQDRQHGAVGQRIEHLGGLPCGRQRSRFRLPVAHDASHDQIGIVEHRTEGMAERVAELPALVNRSRRGRRYMAGDSTRKRELLEQLLQPGFVLSDIRIHLAPRSLKIHIAHDRWPAVTGTGDVEHVEVILLDDPIQMHVDEVLAGCRAPVPDHQRLHVRELQRLPEQRIVIEIDLTDRQVVGGTPVTVHPLQQFGRESVGCHEKVSGCSSACISAKRRRWHGAPLKWEVRKVSINSNARTGPTTLPPRQTTFISSLFGARPSPHSRP